MRLKNIEHVIYKPGECNIQTVLYTDEQGTERAAYSGSLNGLTVDQTVAEYLALHQGMVRMPFDEALREIALAEEKKYIGPWREISADDWMEALEVLPPQNWRTVEGVEFFQMSEMTTGLITAHYARVKGRCFTANRRTTDTYQQLAAEIRELLH